MNKLLLIGFFASTLVGCASITGTTGQSVSIETLNKTGSSVVGASCELTNSKGKWFVNTPGTVAIRRSNDDMNIICRKDGVDPGLATVVSDTKGMMWGNILAGGGIGAIVDHNTGAAYEYPVLIQILMGSNIKIEPPKPKEGESASVGNQSATAPQTAEVKVQGTSQSASQKLRDLNEMQKQGLITQKDYDAKKAEILKAM